MYTSHDRSPEPNPLPAGRAEIKVEVCSFSYEDRREIVARLSQTLAESGCWLMGCKALRPSEMEYLLDVQLRSAVDLYSGLIDAGLELTDSSHRGLTSLCVLRKNHRFAAGLDQVVRVRLAVRFLEAPMRQL